MKSDLYFRPAASKVACKGLSTDSLKLIPISSVLFPNSICFRTSAEYQVIKTYLCFMNDICVNGKFEDCIEEVLQELIQQDESNDEE